nr:MAG TPA: hypothetical protein [Caudoviricetes sp.]
MSIDLYDFLVKKPDSNIIGESVKIVPHGEDGEGDFDIPTGNGDEMFGDSDPSVGQSDDFDMGSSDDGFGFDEEGVEDENGKIINPMEDIENADLSLTTELRGNFATLYKENKATYEKLLSKNLDSSEFGADFKEIEEQYKTILQNIRLYLKNKFDKESIVTKILQLNDFKRQLNTLHDSSNTILSKMGVKEEKEEEIF